MPQDLRRIKQQGPAESDLHEPHVYDTTDKQGNTTTHHESFIPDEVLGSTTYDLEPNWQSLPQMPYMEFYHGLRQRNWTSPYHNAAAPAWDLRFYRDSGRFLRDSFPGYRVLVSKADGSFCWVDLPEAGADTYTKDYISTAVPGTREHLQEIREPTPNVHVFQYGYNHVFEQLFQAYEQKVPKAAKRQFEEQGAVPANYKYNCPGEAIGVSFHMTPQEICLHGFWSLLPSLAFVSFAFSFLAVCLGIGIFR